MGFRQLAIGLFILLFNTIGAGADPVTRDRGAAALAALARIDLDQSRIEDFGSDLHVELALSQPIPWRVFTLEEPRRLVFDFSEVEFGAEGLAPILNSDVVEGLHSGRFQEGWSRVVMELASPMRIETAGLSTDAEHGAVLKIQLAPTSESEFSERAGAPESALFRVPAQPDAGPRSETPRRAGPLRVALDPGHGGFDPGAVADGLQESRLTLVFAAELARSLRAAGMEVVLTRSDDSFVPLLRRVSIARAAEADLFVSIHADALDTGEASGAAVYTLARGASDAASRKLAERLDRSDMIAGVDPGNSDDTVAALLMDLVRRRTLPRSERLADRLVEGLERSAGHLHKRPRHSAGFSVLRGADIPSVLLELGFLSNAADRQRLADPAWRARAVTGIQDGIIAWAQDEDLSMRLLTQ